MPVPLDEAIATYRYLVCRMPSAAEHCKQAIMDVYGIDQYELDRLLQQDPATLTASPCVECGQDCRCDS